jgi:hypothetical protein
VADVSRLEAPYSRVNVRRARKPLGGDAVFIARVWRKRAGSGEVGCRGAVPFGRPAWLELPEAIPGHGAILAG